MSIRQLGQGTPGEDAQIPFYDVPNGVDRRMTVAAARALILGDGASDAEGWITQYEAPNATGFTRPIKPTVNGQSVWLLLMPDANYAGGTLVFPEVSTLLDRQEIEVLCTKNLAALTVNGNGSSVNGAPTALVANEPFKLRFDIITTTWYPAT